MSKTFKKTYVAVGAALTLFAALSLTLMPSIALALTAYPPIAASDGVLSININGGDACLSTERLTFTSGALTCSSVGSGTGTVTGVSAFGSGGLVVTGGASPAPVLGIAACGGTIGTKMLTNKHLSDATWQCDDVPIPLVIGTLASQALAGNTTIPTVIPAIITFTTNTPLSSGAGTIYASLSGSLGTLGPMLTPLPAGTYANLVCRNSVDTGNATSTVALDTGPCGGTTAGSGSLTTTLPDSTAASTTAGSTDADGTDNCGVIKITKTTGYTSGTIHCSLERTS